jgi:hypothetical protein
MQITELVWNLFLILLPGVVSTLMLRYITTSKQYSIFEFVVYSAVLGIGVFVIMELFYSAFMILSSLYHKQSFPSWGLNLSIWDNFFSGKKGFNKMEIFMSYMLAIPMGILWGLLITKRFLLNLFKKLKLTNRFGDDDIWSLYLNSPDTTWIYVRHKSNNITYYGLIKGYSESAEKREILLQEVIAYNSDTWDELYQSDFVYLELKEFDYLLESPNIIEDEASDSTAE